ncbi:MAG: FxsA family protein [Myxococcota bacterium]
MLGKLFLLFTVVPAIELYLLIQLGGVLGAVPTMGIVLTTGFLGASLAKREGSRVFGEWQGALQRGEMPKEGLVSSLLVLVGGVLLVTPGVLTDAFGIAMLIPPSRRVVAGMLQRYVEKRFELQPMTPAGFVGAAASAWSDPGTSGDVIDVEAEEKPAASD